jgi:hypothetical protein
MRADRLTYYQQLEDARGGRLLVYFTGDRQGMETIMHPEVLDRFTEHLDSFNSPDKIILLLHSRGGDTGAGWSIANLIRSFCNKDFEVIVPARAHSAATLLCLGADKIIMTRQATLGPIDPTVNSPLNPSIPGAGPLAKSPVSVEAIKGFVELATEELKIKGSRDMSQVLTVLAANVHPLVLGNAFRVRSHIRMLATNLLEKHMKKERNSKLKIEKIVKFLCSESGSHDYTINRTEARDNLGMKIEKPSDKLYKLISSIYDDIATEMQLKERFDPQLFISAADQGSYTCRRALIESVSGGTDVFISEGVIIKQQVTTPAGLITQPLDRRSFEGWRKENV